MPPHNTIKGNYMSIKTTLIAAAAVALTASSASANAFGFGDTLEDKSTLELGLVLADNAGTVEIYDYSRGQQGALLGVESVQAGANSDVRVNVGSQYKNDVIAVLRVDGEVAATKTFDIAR